MSLPNVLIASIVRYRPDAPEVLADAVASWRAQDWPADKLSLFAVCQIEDDETFPEAASPFLFGERRLVWFERQPRDSRLVTGPRRTGAMQEIAAAMRNLVFRRFEESDADFCLMVDSDVVLDPMALRRMVDIQQERSALSWEKCTTTLQLDNCPWRGGSPHSNGSILTEDGTLREVRGKSPGRRFLPAPYAEDGSVIEVDRAGACTLYPRAALGFRFHWSPAFNEEHQSLFDSMKAAGWNHYIIRDPELADHRMNRTESAREALEAVKADRGA